LGGLDPTLLAIVGATAARLAGTYGFSPADRDDIRQELLLDCVIRLTKFDFAKSSRSTFVHRIVRHRIATLVDAQRAACRDYRRCRESLDDPAHADASESRPLRETLSADGCEAGNSRSSRSPWDHTELQIDVAKVIATLPADLAAVAVALKSAGVVQVAHQLGLSRATIHRRIIRVRELFEAVGLGICSRKARAGRTQMIPAFSMACIPLPQRGTTRRLAEDGPDA
jgi:RNA polymerase sigma-70 factor (ECF subfamily)